MNLDNLLWVLVYSISNKPFFPFLRISSFIPFILRVDSHWDLGMKNFIENISKTWKLKIILPHKSVFRNNFESINQIHTFPQAESASSVRIRIHIPILNTVAEIRNFPLMRTQIKVEIFRYFKVLIFRIFRNFLINMLSSLNGVV